MCCRFYVLQYAYVEEQGPQQLTCVLFIIVSYAVSALCL